jgi:hypothetical protein
MSFSLPQVDLGCRGGQALGVVPSSASSGEAYNQVKHLVGWIFFLLFFLLSEAFSSWDGIHVHGGSVAGDGGARRRLHHHHGPHCLGQR